MKRFLSLLLSAAIMLSLLPAYALAADSGTYVLMNIPYAEFYEAEGVSGVDAVSTATVKTYNQNMAGGSYHAGYDAADPISDAKILGVTYPVYVADASVLTGLTEVKATDTATITVASGKSGTTTKEVTGTDLLFASGDYAYYELDEVPTSYKTLTVDGDQFTFSAASKAAEAAGDLTTTFTLGGHYTDFDLKVTDEAGILSSTVVNGIILSVNDGKTYALRHVEDIWQKTDLGWNKDSLDGNGLQGKTITGITYYVKDGDNYTVYSYGANVYVPVVTDATVAVEDALISSGSTKVTVTGLPADYDAQYTVEGLDATVSGDTLTFPTTAEKGVYTLTVTDKSGKYSKLSASFNLQTDAKPAGYNPIKKALVAANGATAEEFADYIAAISTVSVDGTSYVASGRGAVTIVKEDGTIDTEAAGATEDKVYKFVVNATGYQPLTFNLNDGAYVLMNIPYAEFYEAEGVSGVDAVSSATVKTYNQTMASGSYHAGYDAADPISDAKILGVTYPVYVKDIAALEGKTEVTDSDKATITVAAGKSGTTTKEVEGSDLLFASGDYAYYVLTETPDAYKTLTVDGSKLIFSATSKAAEAADGLTAALTLGGHYTDLTLSVADATRIGDDAVVTGVVLTTNEGEKYALRHVEDIWRKTELGWNLTSLDGKGLQGKTITGITYYVNNDSGYGVYNYTVDVYIPVVTDATVAVEAAKVTAGTTKVTVTGLPEDYDAQYAVEGLETTVSGDTLTFPTTAKAGSYTLTVKDGKGKYNDLTTSFVLSTDTIVAAYDNAKKALVAAKGASNEDLDAYIKSVTSVAVGETTYNATGKKPVTVVLEDGSLDLETAGMTEAKTYGVVVTATGYPDLAFTVDLRAAQTIEVANSFKKTYGDKAFSLGAKATGKLTYASDNTKVATVNKTTGKVTIVGAGTANITINAAATESVAAATKAVKVTVAKGKQTVTVSKTAYTKKVGDKAFSLGAKAAGKLTYTTSNKKVAAVNKTTGKVTIVGAGVAKITVKAAATTNVTAASKTVTITVNPKAVTKLAVKAGKKKTATVTWKINNKTDTYEIQYGTKKNFKGAKTVKAKKAAKTVTLKKLKKGTYYVRVRAVSGKYKSAWVSKTVKIK